MADQFKISVAIPTTCRFYINEIDKGNNTELSDTIDSCTLIALRFCLIKFTRFLYVSLRLYPALDSNMLGWCIIPLLENDCLHSNMF